LSDYISTKFQVSTVAGKHRLQEMLAKMGLPLEECHQPYAFLKPTLRRQLAAKFDEYKDEYGLEHLSFTSFFRIVGYQSLLSAADTSYAVMALLESEDNDLDQTTSFNTALDALNSSQSSLVNGSNLTGELGRGIHLAQYFQRQVVQTATNLIDRKEVTRLSYFRYVYVNCSSESVEETSSAQSHIFAKPLALTRLAHYLMDWYRESGQWKAKPLPLVILAEKPPESYLVVGYEYPETAGERTLNRFGRKFSSAAQSMQGTFRFDSFDCNVVEVNRADTQRFLEQLHYLMDLSEM
jgi:cell division control protein 45